MLTQEVRILDSRGVPISDTVPSLTVTEVDHWMIHKGCSFLHSDPHTVAASGGILDTIMQNTNTGKPVHINGLSVQSTQGDGLLEFFKGVTSDDMGTAEVMYNKNFQSAITPLLTVGHTPTNIATPTAAVKTWLITGGKKGGGDVSEGIDEFILEENVKYLLRFTNLAALDDVTVIDFSTLDVGSL